jgi:hypothetical protein
MKMILVAGLIIASAVFTSADAQINQAPSSPRSVLATGTTSTTVHYERAEMRPNGTYFQKLTLTVGDLVITTDDALLIAAGGESELQLGANARVRIQTK